MFFHLLQTASFDWHALLLGNQKWSFLVEAVLRSVIMFVIVVTSLSILGRRAVRQLSVFELVVIITLGSAAGDPMVYREVGVLSALVIFAMIVLLYQLILYIMDKQKRFKKLLQGLPIYIIKDGRFVVENFEEKVQVHLEAFGELRLSGVMHLGQVQLGIIETSGNVSLFFYADEDVKWGLPILPHLYSQQTESIQAEGHWSCTFCGYTDNPGPAGERTCPKCSRKKWVRAVNNKRIK